MFLAVDIGNTNITYAVFEQDKVLQRYQMETDKIQADGFCKNEFEKVLQNYRIKNCGIISVKDGADNIVKNVCDKIFGIDSAILDYKSCKNMQINIPEPSKAGMDRLANAYAIKNTYKLPAIAVDIGTAITFDVVSKEGNFIGGSIMPGINTQLKSLNLCTSKLPLIQLTEINKVIGNDTQSNILSGVLYGTANAIVGIMKCMETELSTGVKFIGTGGQAEIISKYMERPFDYIEKNLTLIGIKMLYFGE